MSFLLKDATNYRPYGIDLIFPRALASKLKKTKKTFYTGAYRTDQINERKNIISGSIWPTTAVQRHEIKQSTFVDSLVINPALMVS